MILAGWPSFNQINWPLEQRPKNRFKHLAPIQRRLFTPRSPLGTSMRNGPNFRFRPLSSAVHRAPDLLGRSGDRPGVSVHAAVKFLRVLLEPYVNRSAHTADARLYSKDFSSISMRRCAALTTIRSASVVPSAWPFSKSPSIRPIRLVTCAKQTTGLPHALAKA